MELLTIVFRTTFFYFFIVLAYRIMGKREIGQLGIIDLIVSILIAELVAISIENIEDTIFFTIIPIALLVLLELIKNVSNTFWWKTFFDYFKWQCQLQRNGKTTL